MAVFRSAVKFDVVLDSVINKIRKSMNKPVQDFKNKGLSVAVWPGRNGGYTYSVQKRYKDKQSGEWKETKSLFKEEAEALIELLQQALAYGGSRDTHEHEGMLTNQAKPVQPVKYELSEDDIDSIPF